MTRALSLLLVLALTLPAFTAEPTEQLPASARVSLLTVHPTAIELTGPFAYSQLVVTAQLEDGNKLDASRIAVITAPKFVRVSAAAQVRPIEDGSGGLTISLAGKTVEVPVTVPETGELAFACGMDMFKGTVVAQPGA